jgi:RES domain-containing protein
MEILVQVEDLEGVVALDWQMTPIAIPRNLIEWPAHYPKSWRAYPYLRLTQRFGSSWAQAKRSVAIRVPSAVIPGESNYLLNPEHADFARLAIGRAERFAFDSRLGG